MRARSSCGQWPAIEARGAAAVSCLPACGRLVDERASLDFGARQADLLDAQIAKQVADRYELLPLDDPWRRSWYAAAKVMVSSGEMSTGRILQPAAFRPEGAQVWQVKLRRRCVCCGSADGHRAHTPAAPP